MGADNNAVTLAVVAVLATCVGGLIWIIKFLFNKFIPAIDKLTDMTKANTDATKSADTYLRERNGRDNEKHAELVKATQEIPIKMQEIADAQAEAILTSMKQVKEQHVEHQNIDHATINRGKK